MKIRAGVLTISDRCYSGQRTDLSGEKLKSLLLQTNWQDIEIEIADYRIVPDDKDLIQQTICFFIDQEKIDLVLTNGGTGISPRDVTPEATRAVIEKEITGIPEVMRISTFSRSPFSPLSRAVAGSRGKSLIINLPGSPQAVEECWQVIQSLIPHALAVLRGEKTH